MRHVCAGFACFGLASAAIAMQITVDGILDPAYGDPQSAQQVATGFGDAPGGMTGWCDGSELDAAWIRVDVEEGNLYLFFSGNLQSNYNHLEVFVDSISGLGQNALRGDNPDVDFNGLNRMGRDEVNGTPGLAFDTDFEPDFYLTTSMGWDGAGCTEWASISQLLTGGGGVGAYIGYGTFADPSSGSNLIDDTIYGCQLSLNNSNSAGVGSVLGSPSVSDGCGVTTGIEMKIPLSLVSWAGGPVRVCAFINGQNHDYASNQVLGTLPPGTSNLGGDGSGAYVGGSTAVLRFNFADIAGKQHFSSVDPPACVSTCVGDLDRSGTLDAGDLALLLLAYGVAPPPGHDLDGDGEVSSADLSLILVGFGPCSP